MPPNRILPRVGAPAEVVTLATRTPAVITAVDGREIEARDATGAVARFTLHPATGHFVLAGGPYWGTRLELLSTDARS